MSIPVELPQLAQVMARYGFAYLMTTNAHGAPHAVAVQAVLQGGDVVVSQAGRRTRENALARPAVGLVWPPQTAGDYSLIVDGLAAATDQALRITPMRAVLHRPAPPAEPRAPGACGADCVPLAVGDGAGEGAR